MQFNSQRSRWFHVALLSCITVEFAALATVSLAQDSLDKAAERFAPKLSETEQRIEAAFARQVTCKYQNTALADVVADLAKQVDMPIELDDQGLKQAGVDRTTPITFVAGPLSLRSVLSLLEVRHQIGYMPGLSGLRLTTEEIVDEDRNLIVRVHPINDLLKDFAEPVPAYGGYVVDRDYESLIDLMSSHVDASSWTDNGGTGAISGFGGSLVVRQTLDRQHRVAEILAGLRKFPLKAGTMVQIDAGPAPTALAQPISGEAKGDLNDFAKQVNEAIKIPIVIDTDELKHIEGTAVPVLGGFQEQSGYHVLKRMLQPLGLSAVAFPEFVWITEDGKEPPRDTRLYSVDGLVNADELQPPPVWYGFGALDEVIDLITSTVDPDQWTDNGGECKISGMYHPACVAVTASHDIHLQIEPLLDALREKRKEELAQRRNKDDKIVQRVYQLYLLRRQLKTQLAKPAAVKPAPDKPTGQSTKQPRALAQFGSGISPRNWSDWHAPAEITDPIPSGDDVAALIRELLSDPSWKEEGVLLKPFHDVLIVRQRPPMLRKIEKLLKDIDAWHDPAMQGMGGHLIPVVGDRPGR